MRLAEAIKKEYDRQKRESAQAEIEAQKAKRIEESRIRAEQFADKKIKQEQEARAQKMELERLSTEARVRFE